MLILEGAQAGLSWSTILRKRDAYRRAFSRLNNMSFHVLHSDEGASGDNLRGVLVADPANPDRFLSDFDVPSSRTG